MQKLRQQFPKASLQQLVSLQGASVDKLTTLKGKYQSGDAAGARQMTMDMGLLGQVSSAGDVDNLLADKRNKVLQSNIGFGVDEARRKRIEADIAAGRKPSDDDQSFYSGLVGLKGVSGVGELGVLSNRSANKMNPVNAVGGRVGSGEDTIRAAAAGDSKVFAEGMGNFQKALGGYEALGQTMLKVAAALKPEEYAKGSKEAAAEFKIPAQQFGTHVATFKTAIDNFISGMSGIFGKNMGGKPDLSGQVNTKQSR
jgi:hypothetical protein